MYRTFNCGIGMVVAIGAGEAQRAARVLRDAGEAVYEIGEVTPGTCQVRIGS